MRVNMPKLFNKGSKNEKEQKQYSFQFEPKKLNVGKETLQENSLIQAMYKDFIVTKTGHLVSLIQGSGINLDLLNENEQEDVFLEFNSFLMATLGNGGGEIQQYLDMTIPVDFKTYLLFLKMRYLEVKEKQPNNKALIALIASYVDYFQRIANNNEMSTKMHVLAIREKIKNKSEKSLVYAAENLEERTNQLIRDLTTNLEDHDMEARQMTEREVLLMLKQMINASGH